MEEYTIAEFAEDSDNEDIFYGYYLPYQGVIHTDSLSGITDSAAGTTALACGYKTINSYVGKDQYGEDVQSLTELAISLGKATAVMSTDLQTGATPAGFSSHAMDRNDTSDILEGQVKLMTESETIFECGLQSTKEYQFYITEVLDQLEICENGFFLMYEEGYIDKNSHNDGDMDSHFTKFGLEYDTLYYPSNAEFITQITMEMEHDFLSDKSNRTEFINAKTDELFIKLHRVCFSEDVFVAETTTQALFRELQGTVFSTLKEPWTIERMAKQVNLSPSRFHALYKKIFGRSPMDDLIHARIQNAQNALLFSNDSISDIASELGYSNLPHFIRQFKAISGTTPSQYRESRSETPAPLHIQQNDYQSENRREFRINHKDYLEIRRIR